MIPENKILIEKEFVVKNCKKCGGAGCNFCINYCSFIDKMVESNIPVDYWHRNMKNFYGDSGFSDEVNKYILNIKENYYKGASLCFAGPRGTGKTMGGTCILKEAIKKGFSAHYITMVDIVQKLTTRDSYGFRSLLKKVDFLFIDEVDQRFFPTDNSSKLFGNHFENIFRTRVQNKMPTIMCTNSEDVDSIFSGQFKESFSSLRSQFVKEISVFGKDARKGAERGE